MLNKQDTENLYISHQDLLLQIQGLYDNTAKIAVYLLSGTIPVEAELHKCTLCLFGQITRQEGPLRDIALRQIGIKDTNSNSWFMYIDKIAETWNWPNPGPSVSLEKKAWSRYISDNIGNHWFSSLTEQVLNYSTLSMLVLMGVHPNTPHSLWQVAGTSTYQVKAATARARLLTGNANLQVHRTRFKQHPVDATYPLCKQDNEKVAHHLVLCTETHSHQDSPNYTVAPHDCPHPLNGVNSS